MMFQIITISYVFPYSEFAKRSIWLEEPHFRLSFFEVPHGSSIVTSSVCSNRRFLLVKSTNYLSFGWETLSSSFVPQSTGNIFGEYGYPTRSDPLLPFTTWPCGTHLGPRTDALRLPRVGILSRSPAFNQGEWSPVSKISSPSCPSFIPGSFL